MNPGDLPVQLALAPGVKPAFPATSRYAGLPLASLTAPDRTETVYVTRRLIPPPDRFSIAGMAEVGVNDRLDLVAARVYGRADLDWRIADAAGASDPDTLTEVAGRKLAAPHPGPTHQASGDA